MVLTMYNFIHLNFKPIIIALYRCRIDDNIFIDTGIAVWIFFGTIIHFIDQFELKDMYRRCYNRFPLYVCKL